MMKLSVLQIECKQIFLDYLIVWLRFFFQSSLKGERMEIKMQCGKHLLPGFLNIPKNANTLVIFVHGSGSSRFSQRNQWVAQYLNQFGFATLLFDLLTSDEEAIDAYSAKLRFDIPMLTNRLIEVTDWCKSQKTIKNLPIAYYGASTGAGAALIASARRGDIHAVVSRGGRVDLAGDALLNVNSPTLLIVGGNDEVVLDLNRQAMALIPAKVKLHVVNGASHLFEEPGTLEEVAQISKDWLLNS